MSGCWDSPLRGQSLLLLGRVAERVELAVDGQALERRRFDLTDALA